MIGPISAAVLDQPEPPVATIDRGGTRRDYLPVERLLTFVSWLLDIDKLADGHAVRQIVIPWGTT